MSTETAVRHRPAHAHNPGIPHEAYHERGRLKIVIAGLDQNVRAQAVEAANAALNEQTTQRGFKGFLKRVWHGSIAREHYLGKYRREATREIEESGNLLHHQGVVDDETKTQVTMRFAHEYDAVLHRQAGEHRTLVLDTNEDGTPNEQGTALKEHIFDLIERYSRGEFASDTDFEEEKRRMMTAMVQQGLAQDHIGRGMLYADNLLQIAQNVNAMAAQRRLAGENDSVREILRNADLVMGEARTGARTEIKESRVERITSRLTTLPWVNESTVASAVTIAYSAAGWATRSAAGALSTAILAPGAAAGVWAGLRERRALNEERTQHARDMAQGKFEGQELTGRRAKLEQTRYETKSALDLRSQLGILYDDEGVLRLDPTDRDRFQEALAMISEVEARIHMSDRDRIDLISYSNVESVERERFDLDLSLAKAKVDLRHFIEDASDDELQALLGGNVTPEMMARIRAADTDSLDFVMNPPLEGVTGLLQGQMAEFDQEVTAKDRVFRKLRRREVTKAVLVGTVIGMTIGTAVQEGMAVAIDDRQGVIESGLGWDNDASSQTMVESLRQDGLGIGRSDWEDFSEFVRDPMAYNNNEVTTVSSIDGETIQLVADTSSIKLPDGFTMEQHGQEFIVKGPNGFQVDHLALTKDGTLTAPSIDALNRNGLHLLENHDLVSNETQVEDKVTAKEFLKNHDDLATKVTRDFWYDNDTSMYWENGVHKGADYNELGLWNPEYEKGGNISISTNLSNKGSWHGNNRAHWQRLATEGKLQIALSLTQGTQSEVFFVPIDADGKAVIGKDSPLYSLFGERGGHPDFNGRYTEIVEVHDVDKDGVTHIRPIATDIGPGHKNFTDFVSTTETRLVSDYALEYTGPPDDVLIPPIIPLRARRGLEQPRQPFNNPNYLSSYFDIDPATRQEYLDRMSPRLREGSNPDVELDEREEAEWYWNNQTPEHQAIVTSLAEQITAMHPTTEIVVAMPVAGHQEGDNIYRTLSAYLDQSLDRERFELVLYVNHPVTDPSGRPTSAQQTLDEITRFQRDHPDFPVQVMYERLERSDATIGNIRKRLNDAIIKRSLDRTETPGQDLIVVSNDADTIQMSNIYLENFINKYRANPNVDAMLGQLDWDNDAFIRYPELHVATRLFLYHDIIERRAGGNIGSSGANFSMKMKNYAAVGGYASNSRVGEDVELGRALKAARHGGTREAVGYAGNAASRLETSARRAAYVYETFNDAPYNQWSYSFSADDDAVRAFTVSGPAPDLSDPRVRTEIISRTESLINRTLPSLRTGQGGSLATGISAKEREFIERTLHFCGLQFEWRDNKSIHITDASAMLQGIAAFAERHKRKQTERPSPETTGPMAARRTPEEAIRDLGGIFSPGRNKLGTIDANFVVEGGGEQIKGKLSYEGYNEATKEHWFTPVNDDGSPRHDGTPKFAMEQEELLRLIRTGAIRAAAPIRTASALRTRPRRAGARV
jgi:hypothetical protein